MKSPSFSNQHFLMTSVVALLAAGSLFALPEPIACWHADGDDQPEPDGKARTTNSVDIAYRQGITGKAFSFNGKTSEFEAELIPNSLKSPAMTWSVWIRPAKPTGYHSQTILSATYYVLSIEGGQFTIYANGRTAKSEEPVKWDTWQHVAVVFATDHATIYHKGKTTTTPRITNDLISLYLKKLFIGGSGNDYSHYSGVIDEVAIYDGELTQTEIADLATRPKESDHDKTTKPDAKTAEATTKSSPSKPAQVWTNTEGKAITAEFVRVDGESVVVKNGGAEFRIPFAKLAAASIQQALASAGAALIPAAATTLQIKVASSNTQIDRWGTGEKALVFFSHTGPMNESVVASINAYAPLFAGKYSIFLWNYPTGKPFSETQAALQSWMNRVDSKVNFAGVATDVVDGIRAQTGIKEFLLVGDSLGAGILLADYARLTTSGNVRFVLISPTEPFSPPAKDLPPLQNSILLANSKGDYYSRSSGFTNWIEWQKTSQSLTGPLPLGHLILGENLSHAQFVKILADFSRTDHRQSGLQNSGANPIQSPEGNRATALPSERVSLAQDMAVPRPPNPKFWYWPHAYGAASSLGMPRQHLIQYLWGALQLTNTQMDKLMDLWLEIVVKACNEDEKQWFAAVKKYQVERESLLTPSQIETRQRIVKYYKDLTTQLKEQGLSGDELDKMAAEQARKELPALLNPLELEGWRTVENSRKATGGTPGK